MNKSKVLDMFLRIFSACVIVITLITIIKYNKEIREENLKTMDILIFMESSLTTQELQEIRMKIEKVCDTTDIQYRSEEEMLEDMKKQFEQIEIDWDIFNKDELPNSCVVTIKSKNYSEIKDKLMDIKGIRNVREL